MHVAPSSPVGLCADCGRPVRGGRLCTICLALLHPLCARGGTTCTSCSTCDDPRSLLAVGDCFDSSSTDSEGSSDDLSACDTILDAACGRTTGEVQSLLEERTAQGRLVAFLERQLREARLQLLGGTAVHRRASWPSLGRTARSAAAPRRLVSIVVTDADAAPLPRRLELLADDNGVDLTVAVQRGLAPQGVLVSGTVRPGAGLPQLLEDLHHCLLRLGPQDGIVLVVGANDSTHGELPDLLKHFNLSVTSPLVFLAEVPRCSSCDRHQNSSVGSPSRVVVVSLGNCLSRADYLPRGRLINKHGKRRVAKAIVDAVRGAWAAESTL